MKRFLNAVRLGLAAGKAWDRARQLAMRGLHKEALAAVDALPPEAASTLRWRLFYLQQEYALGLDHAVASAAPPLLADIDAAPRLSADEKRYLRAYIMWLQARAAGVDASASFRDVDLNKIPAHWKDNFPLRGHPHWTDD